MLRVNNKQLDIMSIALKDQFIRETVKDLPVYYPEWTESIGAPHLKDFVETLFSFAHKNSFFETDHILDLIHWDINYKLLDRLKKDIALQNIISNKLKSDKHRMSDLKIYFIKHINN